jgi:peptidoglycan hydrolase-like protein with peptidoglycan-binding domain
LGGWAVAWLDAPRVSAEASAPPAGFQVAAVCLAAAGHLVRRDRKASAFLGSRWIARPHRWLAQDKGNSMTTTSAAPPSTSRSSARSLAALVALLLGCALAIGGGWTSPAAALTNAQLQENLAGMGYYSGPIDGQVGSVTTAAVKKYQADRCTARDGVAGSTTQGLMATEIKQIQAKVGTTQDGWYGPGTKAKVVTWQKANGLTGDGVAGPVTMSKMGIKRVLTCVGTLTFDKNPSAPNDSRLIFTVKREGVAVVSYSWRSGSGKSSVAGATDDCKNDIGWLPNGSYDIDLFTNYQGSLIHEWALRLSRNGSVYVPCSKGTTNRFDLFIHQDYSGGNYTSSGCITITRTNVQLLHDKIQTYFGTSGSGGRTPFKLSVIS